MSNNKDGIVRVLFHTIDDGDRLKFRARSNTSGTGGGARDLRFRPESEFFPFFRRMFPNRESKQRQAKGSSKTIEILSGTAYWKRRGITDNAVIEVWPATDARQNECRIARVSSLDLRDLIEDDPASGRSIFMIYETADGQIWLYFTTQTSLQKDPWHQEIKKFAEFWIKTQKKSAFLDFETQEQYPDD